MDGAAMQLISNVFTKRAATGTVILWDWETSKQA